MVVLGGVAVLILPFIGIGVARCLFGKNIFDNPEFWYGYMAYFGATLLATVALYENVKVDEINRILTIQQLRQKIGYFELKKEKEIVRKIDEHQFVKFFNTYSDLLMGGFVDSAGQEDESKKYCLGVCLKNVGEDIILNLKVLTSKINGDKTDISCLNHIPILSKSFV